MIVVYCLRTLCWPEISLVLAMWSSVSAVQSRSFALMFDVLRFVIRCSPLSDGSFNAASLVNDCRMVDAVL